MAVISGHRILFPMSLPSNWRIKSQKVLQGLASASGALIALFLCTLMLFCPVISWCGVQTKCAFWEKQPNLVELNLTGQRKAGTHRPREALAGLCFSLFPSQNRGPRHRGARLCAATGLFQNHSFQIFYSDLLFKPGSQTFKSEAILFS